MKRIVILVVCMIRFFSIAVSQPYEYSVPLDETLNFVTDMIQTNNGNFIISGRNVNQVIVTVTSVNEDGEILWTKHLSGDMDWYSNIIERSNGNLLVPMSSYYSKLIELNSEGDSVDCLMMEASNQSLFGSIIELNDSILIASELIRNSDPFFQGIDSSFIVKIDKNLNVIDKFPFDYNYIMNLKEISNNEFFVLGRPNYFETTYIISLNLNGEIISQSTCSNSQTLTYPFKIYRLNNNKFIAFGYQEEDNEMSAHLNTFNSSGEIYTCNGYSNPYFMSVTNNESNEMLYALGYENSSSNIYSLDYDGNLLNTIYLNDSIWGNNIIYDEGSFYLAGSYEENSLGSRFIRIQEDSVFSIKETEDLTEIINYPNPASITTIFEVPRWKEITKGEIKIMNVMGREIVRLPVKSDITIWDCHTFEDGIYIYFLEIRNQSCFGKVLIRK